MVKNYSKSLFASIPSVDAVGERRKVGYNIVSQLITHFEVILGNEERPGP